MNNDYPFMTPPQPYGPDDFIDMDEQRVFPGFGFRRPWFGFRRPWFGPGFGFRPWFGFGPGLGLGFLGGLATGALLAPGFGYGYPYPYYGYPYYPYYY